MKVGIFLLRFSDIINAKVGGTKEMLLPKVKIIISMLKLEPSNQQKSQTKKKSFNFSVFPFVAFVVSTLRKSSTQSRKFLLFT